MKRFTHLVALVVSFALVACTAAAIGSVSPDDRAVHGSGAVTREQLNDVVHPDDRATHGPGTVAVRPRNDVVRPDDRAIHGSTQIALQVTRSSQVPIIAPNGSEAARAEGFDWFDAGIGAAAALGLGLIIGGGVAFVLRRTHAPAYS